LQQSYFKKKLFRFSANKPLKCALKMNHFSIFSAGQYEWGGGRYLIDKNQITNQGRKPGCLKCRFRFLS